MSFGDPQYERQRIDGAEQVLARFQAMARERGIELVESTWVGGIPQRYRDFHILEAASDARSVQERFSDEELADYPGGAGTDPTIAKLEALLQELAS